MNKFESSPVTREFKRQKQAHLSEPGIRVIAGVSGGPDSMALLYLLHRFEVKTIVVHCNYQLRGNSSNNDQKLVEEASMLWNMECVSLRFESKMEAEGNFQNWARTRRYQVFRDLKKEYGTDLILTAHHQDDQIETILQKILRGAGIGAWKGMEIKEHDLLRPLLHVPQSEIMDFVEEFNVPYRIDRSNEESTYARNFIRHHWFPDLNRLFPGWKKNLLRLSKRAEEFQAMTDQIMTEVVEKGDLNREKFLNLDPKIRPAVLHRFITRKGIDVELSQGFLQCSNELGGLQSGGKLQISKGYFIIRDRTVFMLADDSNSPRIHRKIEFSQLEPALAIAQWNFSIEPVPETFNEHILHLDIDMLEFPLTLRTWKDGDVFQPFGMDGSQLISDHLTNRKIPSTVRSDALVLESFDGMICAVIFPNYSNSEQAGTISNNVRCTDSTTRTLTIRNID